MTILILPKLKSDSDVRPADESGKWDLQQAKAFQDVASSLDYKAPGQVKSVSSVPTMWARALSMEMALHNPYYPIRQEMIQQWQGMLGAIALAEVRGFPLKAQLVCLGSLKDKEPFAHSLYELLPDPVNSLYSLTSPPKHAWEDIYIFLWHDKAVGMSSPSTLVVPAEEGIWTNLPWWNDKTGKLESPHHRLNNTERALLWRWLENLRDEVGNKENKYRGQKQAINTIGGLIEDFRQSLGNYPEQILTLSNNPQFFQVPLNRGVLIALNKPVKVEAKPSSVRLIKSPEKTNVLDLLILDREISTAWNESPQNIWVYGNQTLASLNIEALKNKTIIWEGVRWIESKDLFLPEFKFVDLEDALPGAFLPPGIQINFNGQRVTPLLPLNPILLEYFTSEELIRHIQLNQIQSSEGSVLRFSLDLPLSGTNGTQNYRIFKDYQIKEENALPEVPVLEIWPHFRAEGWRSYYAFYYDAEFGDETFQVNLPSAREPHLFKDGRGSYQITRLEEFPSYINCQDRDRRTIGLILLRTPELNRSTGSWRVGVDFGTSFTNIYVNRKGVVESLPLQSLHLKVTEVQIDTRNPVLFEYFVPESFIPPDKPLPLSSILTIRGNTHSPQGKERPIYDGRIYVPDRNRFKPQEDWIETDLKWTNLVANRLFLQHLGLHISALAAQNNVKQVQWCLSYPSAFSNRDRKLYAQNWQDLTKELHAQTGITHLCPEVDELDYFRTESLAIAQYFADREGYDLVGSTCIDMGGGTSDISIWEDNQLLHQCSVQLAGRDLFSQFLELNPKFIQKFDVKANELQGLKEGNFNAKLDVLLRLESDNWLKKIAFLQEDPEFQGLIRLVAIGTAGLYYYVGTILGVLSKEEKYQRNEITPVYVGGNGSRLLNWLDVRGKFDRNSEINELFSRMLSKGSDFEDTEEKTRLSQQPKDEVACGLVLSDTKLQGLKKKAKDPLIAGENCELNNELINYQDRLEFDGEIKNFKISRDLEQLKRFLYEFNLGLRDLEIEGITPMPGFRPKVGLESSYDSQLWRNTLRELDNTLLKIKGNSENIRVEPPFILALKALLRVLGKEWAGK
ncbi:hypothetical protein [Merismopedia glauca]|uniref:Uncharacterized protein n=1 Tax=Merismopedia glauca CCAP 1448/3 TaxID=1296344 RepID=A0A2T1C7P7_9CYAN|nr:hypothetical protein [Merismopedia glauca]PSB04279.1 hypothetical protein C7B64_04780 [Merismopedia glauca CCAP 1448/3]